MIENLQEYMKHKFDYIMDSYVLFKKEYRKTPVVPIAVSVFLVIFVVWILDASFGWGFLKFWMVAVLFVVLVLMPIAFKKNNKYQGIVVTPDYLIEIQSKTEFVPILFDDITEFHYTNAGMVVKDKKHTITCGLEMSRDQLDPIIEILEAKGKTFDPGKDYMIRPIEIRIVNGVIKIVEIETETHLDRIYEKYSKKYQMLTPGYLSEIIFQNANVEDICIDDEMNNFGLYIDSFEVKDGHPENTKFESIIAQDCIVIFNDLKIKSLVLSDNHKKDVADIVLPNKVDELEAYLTKAVITSWKTGKKRIDFVFATGVHSLRCQFEYKEVFLGWNKVKE